MKKILILTITTCLIFCLFSISFASFAKEPEHQISFAEGLGTLVPENAGLDSLAHSASSQAVKFSMYNIGWAGRYGATAFVIKGVNLDVSATKNRYIVMNVAVDALASQNSFDNLISFYNTADGAEWVPVSVDANSLSSLHGAAEKEFQYVIVDLAWASESHLNDLRLEVKSSSLEKSADPVDNAYNCGFFYLRDISFFNTLDDAKSFVDPNYVPEAPNPGTDVDNPNTGDSALLGALIAFVITTGAMVFSAKKQRV